MWDVLVGDVKIGRLTDPRADLGTTRCVFFPTADFGRYAAAFADGDISREENDPLDDIIDDMAVAGVFLVSEDGAEIVDPDLRIEGTSAWFSDQSTSST